MSSLSWLQQIHNPFIHTNCEKEMNRSLKNLTIEELKKLLKRDTKIFIDGLENGLTVTELKTLRAHMKEIRTILEEKTKYRR